MGWEIIRYTYRITLNNGLYYVAYTDDDKKEHKNKEAFLMAFSDLIQQHQFINVNTAEGKIVIYTKNIANVKLLEVESSKGVDKFINALNERLDQSRAIKENRIAKK